MYQVINNKCDEDGLLYIKWVLVVVGVHQILLIISV